MKEILTKLFCTSVPILVILAWIVHELCLTLRVNRDLNQGLLHLWSKFGDPSLNKSQVIAWTSNWLIHTHGHMDTRTHRQTQARTIPEGQNWPWVKKVDTRHPCKIFNDWYLQHFTWKRPQNYTHDDSTLVQVMTWGCQACFMTPYGATGCQWVNWPQANIT